jgi:transposase-like protein
MEQKTQRWTAQRKAELALGIIKGEISMVDACRQNDLKQSEVESWISTFIQTGTQGLKTNSREQMNEYERQIKEMQTKIGELVLEIDARKKLEALRDREETNS